MSYRISGIRCIVVKTGSLSKVSFISRRYVGLGTLNDQISIRDNTTSSIELPDYFTGKVQNKYCRRPTVVLRPDLFTGGPILYT